MMHRRNGHHHGGDCCPPPLPTTKTTTTTTTTTPSDDYDVSKHKTTKPSRIRRRGGVSASKLKLKPKNLDYTMEDFVVHGIQLLCVSMLIACGVALLYKRVCGPQGCDSMFSYGKDQRKHGHFDLHPLPPSSVYTIPNSMPHIGDKTDAYAALRQAFDRQELPKIERKLSFGNMEMKDTGHQVAYDIYNCPDHPVPGYPYEWKLTDVLDRWPPDDPNPPSELHQGLCVFDYTTDYAKALRYRQAEVPFVVRNDPQVAATAARWNAPHYMEQLMGHVQHRAEYSDTNHFLYWNAPPKHSKNKKPHDNKEHQHHPKPRGLREMHPPENWKEPTKMIRMTYADWLGHANVTDDLTTAADPHWYFRLIGCGETGPEGQCDAGSSEYLFDELPYFQPQHGTRTNPDGSLYIVDPDQQKGIHCRFGMRGVIAENHFDGSRNAIAVLGGERRYILSHPKECPHLALFPKDHPSARHSAVDWSSPDLETYPEFELAQGNEVVMQAGDVLYLPTNWFHYIVSLSLNFQCNTRSGITQDYMPPIRQCGF
jgi:hypothetical protein